MAMAQAAIADVVAPRERGRYQGYMAGTWGVASVAGPILGGWITDDFSWRWIFWINLPIGVAAYVLSDRALQLLKAHAIAAADRLCRRHPADRLRDQHPAGDELGRRRVSVELAQVILVTLVSVVLLAVLVAQERTRRTRCCRRACSPTRVFTRGVIVASLAAAAMFGGTFLLPLFFQLLHGADAASSGTLIVPFLAANVVGAFTAGQLARWLGRAKAIVLGGLFLAIAGFTLLGFLGVETSHFVSVLDMFVVGFGLGITMPSALVIVQNAAERRDVGVATGTLLFLRSMGAALGSTLVGTLLAARFAAGLGAAGGAAGIDLGALRGHAAGGVKLPPELRDAAMAALANGFHWAFLACAALSGLAFVTCLWLRDLQLKSSAPR